MGSMNEVAIQTGDTFSLSPRNLGEAMEFAKIIASSDMVPKDYLGKPGNVLVAVQTGAELGLKPMQSLQCIAVINGRPAVWGDGMWALIVSHPDFEGFRDENTDTQSTVWLKRRGQGEIMRSFSMDDAKKAGLSGKQGPWTTAPKRMMQMRARAFAARDLFPDALKGIRSVEELRDYPAEPTERDITPEAQQSKVIAPSLIDCSAEHFQNNAEAWRGVIISKRKTPAALIAMLSTKLVLTEDQKLTIDSWSHEENDATTIEAQ